MVFQNQDSLGDDVLQIFKNGDGKFLSAGLWDTKHDGPKPVSL